MLTHANIFLLNRVFYETNVAGKETNIDKYLLLLYSTITLTHLYADFAGLIRRSPSPKFSGTATTDQQFDATISISGTNAYNMYACYKLISGSACFAKPKVYVGIDKGYCQFEI